MDNSQNISILFDDSSKELLKTGISQTLEQYESLLLDLFDKLRDAGMAITLEQYELLQKAIEKGYGLGGWEDLKKVCRLLWVKPCPNYDLDVFNQAFDDYYNQHLAKISLEPELKEPQDTPPTAVDPVKPPPNLPQIPPRKWQSLSTQEIGKVETPTAIKSDSNLHQEVKAPNFVLTPQDFPIKLKDVQRAWKLLKQPVQIGWEDEIDMEATVERIEQEGILADLVMHPRMTRQTELLLLIDDHSAMIPFFPGFEPFIAAIKQSRITPAKIYRFTSYPDQYLYEWERPTQAHPVTDILRKLHSNRTIALILSDAGAATASYSQDRIEGIFRFLMNLSPCIRQLIWLNPLPYKRWEQTSAWEIYRILNGKMLNYDAAELQTIAKEFPQQNIIQPWQIHPQQ